MGVMVLNTGQVPLVWMGHRDLTADTVYCLKNLNLLNVQYELRSNFVMFWDTGLAYWLNVLWIATKHKLFQIYCAQKLVPYTFKSYSISYMKALKKYSNVPHPLPWSIGCKNLYVYLIYLTYKIYHVGHKNCLHLKILERFA